MHKIVALCCVILFTFLFSIAQLSAQKSGKLKIHQSEGISKIVDKHKTLNKEKPQIVGWRVQIFSVSGVKSRDKANEVIEAFNKLYPDADAYIVYNEPQYRVRIGNFRTQIEALYFLQTIMENYPYAFPVIDYIEYPSFN